MASQVSVTCTLNDPSGSLLTNASSAFVRFILRQFQGFVPLVQGTSILCEIQIDATPNSSGVVTQNLWPNNAITPASTFYEIQWWNLGRITSRGNYLINAATNLNSAAQLNAPPVPAGFSLVLENNGTLNSSQSTLNLESTDGSVAITDLGSGNINLQSVASGFGTAGKGWLWSSGEGLYGAGPTSETYTTYTAVANTVVCYQLMVSVPITIRKATIAVSGTAGGATINAGIYTLDGNTKLMDVSFSAAASGIQTAALGTPLTLSPGVYWFAFSNTGQPNVSFGPSLQAGPTSLIAAMNKNVQRIGTAANVTSGGVMPASLGALSAYSSALPVFLLEV